MNKSNEEEISNSLKNENSMIEKEMGEIKNEKIEDEEEEGIIMEDIQSTELIDKSLCEMCKVNKWKYTCPKCLMHTCSLPCVKGHKKELNCDGKRDKVKYVSMNEYNENNLRNDYYFLEDVARANDNANREQNDFRRNKHSQKKNAILKQARKKDIILKFMPTGMKKSQINKIYYNIKAKEINWTVELNFPDSEKKLKLIRTRIKDNMKIKDIINNCLCEKEGNAMTRHNLSNYIEEKIENLKVFLKREEIPANKQEYYSVNINSSICEILAFKVVIEYPSFFILIPTSTFLDNYKIINEEEQERLKQELKKKQEEERKKIKNNNQKKKNNTNDNNNNDNNNINSEVSTVPTTKNENKSNDNNNIQDIEEDNDENEINTNNDSENIENSLNTDDMNNAHDIMNIDEGIDYQALEKKSQNYNKQNQHPLFNTESSFENNQSENNNNNSNNNNNNDVINNSETINSIVETTENI